MECIMCGTETSLFRSFDRVTAGFCEEHFSQAGGTPLIIGAETSDGVIPDVRKEALLRVRV